VREQLRDRQPSRAEHGPINGAVSRWIQRCLTSRVRGLAVGRFGVGIGWCVGFRQRRLQLDHGHRGHLRLAVLAG
jgi:hypothetical protein